MRRILLSGLAALSLLSAPAFADGLKIGGIPLASHNYFTGFQGGPVAPYAGYGLLLQGPQVTSNLAVGANIVSGVGNSAVQDTTIFQGSAAPGGGLATSNIANGLNLVTGMNNLAAQFVLIGQ